MSLKNSNETIGNRTRDLLNVSVETNTVRTVIITFHPVMTIFWTQSVFLSKRKGRSWRRTVDKRSKGKMLFDRNGTHSHNQLDLRRRCDKTVLCDSSLRPVIRKDWSNLWTYREAFAAPFSFTNKETKWFQCTWLQGNRTVKGSIG